MDRVSIHYDDGSTVEANELGDAINHIAVTGSDRVVEIREDPPPRGPCKHCDGSGLAKRVTGKRLLTKKQIEERVTDLD